MNKFVKIGNAIAKALVPGVEEAEETIKGWKQGGARRDFVLKLINERVVVPADLKEEDILDPGLFHKAISNINDGFALLRKSIKD